jgi:hypothetical protein
MKYCVLAKISRRTVTFWYQSESNPYAPLSLKESNEVPLYFYVNENDFIFGSAARELFNRHEPNAYGNYFEIIKDPGSHFTIYGNKKPVKQLFYYGIEQYLSHFLNTVLYKAESIESYRQHFPLRFMFDSDVEDHEQSLIEHLFKEAGYFNLDRVNYNKALFQVLSQKNILPSQKAVLLLNGVDNVLYAKLYREIDNEPAGAFKLEGQGADPRVRILADMIVEYIIVQNSYLSIDKELEIGVLLPFCASLLLQTTAIITGDAELADGTKHWFKVNAHNLHDRLQYYSNDNIIYTAIDDLLSSAGLKTEEVMILLGSEEISTNYFSAKLLKKYQFVNSVKAPDIKDALKVVFAAIASDNPSPPAAKAPVVPLPKLPPPLPPKKVSSATPAVVNIPKLPEARPAAPPKINPVKLPPLPPKR